MGNPDAQANSSATLGAYLRDKRLSRNIALEEVSASTGISPAVLGALEDENREQLPSEVYVKAFYKKYAEYLGLDPDEIRGMYQKDAKGLNKKEPVSGFSTVIKLKGQEETLLVETLRRLFLPIAILVLGLILFWIYKNYLEPQNILGFCREQFPAVCSFFPAHPFDFPG